MKKYGYFDYFNSETVITEVREREDDYLVMTNGISDFTISKDKLIDGPPAVGDNVGCFYHTNPDFVNIRAGIELRGKILWMLSVSEMGAIRKKEHEEWAKIEAKMKK